MIYTGIQKLHTLYHKNWNNWVSYYLIFKSRNYSKISSEKKIHTLFNTSFTSEMQCKALYLTFWHGKHKNVAIVIMECTYQKEFVAILNYFKLLVLPIYHNCLWFSLLRPIHATIFLHAIYNVQVTLIYT